MFSSASHPLHVFLCYAKEDRATVLDLYRRLDSEGWIDVWLDEIKLYPGQEWDLEIEKAVEAADVIIVCLTSKSVNKQGYVQRELRYVLDQADYKPEGRLFVIPIRLEECNPPRRLLRWQYMDYFPLTQRDKAYQRLLVSLRSSVESLNSVQEEGPEKFWLTQPTAGITSQPDPNIKNAVSRPISFEPIIVVIELESFIFVPSLIKLDDREIPVEAEISEIAGRQIVIFDERIKTGKHQIFVAWSELETDQLHETFYNSTGPTTILLSAKRSDRTHNVTCKISIKLDFGDTIISPPVIMSSPVQRKLAKEKKTEASGPDLDPWPKFLRNRRKKEDKADE